MTTLALALLMTLDVGNGPIDPGTHYETAAPKVHHHHARRPRAPIWVTVPTAQGPRVVTFGYCLAYFQAVGLDWDASLIVCARARL